MIIGLDFDNTLVKYDEIFHAVALEHGYIEPALPVDKTAVRDFIRARGGYDEWTALQGEVYGNRMSEARLFPGVTECLAQLAENGHRFYIISHKTRFAKKGTRHDLHAAARDFLRSNGLFSPEYGLSREQVFFCPEREEKIARIAACGCRYFIDDLPEVFLEPAFPPRVGKILFAPRNRIEGDWRLCSDWSDIYRYLEYETEY